MDVTGTPRSLDEVVFLVRETPCEGCGQRHTVRPTIENDEADGRLIVRGTCDRCGRARELRMAPVRSYAGAPDDAMAIGDEPSEILSDAVLLAAAERDLAEVPAVVASDPAAARKGHLYLRAALRAVNELGKLVAAGGSGIPMAKVEALRAQIAARLPAWAAAAPPLPTFRAPATLRDLEPAHRAWVERGRTGDGRLVLRDAALGDTRHGPRTLVAASFERCRFDRSEVSSGTLDESSFVECSMVRINLSSAKLHRARFVDCRLAEATLSLAELRDAVIERGDWHGMAAGRSSWHRARVTGVDLRETRLRDAVLDDAVFTGCDLRGVDLRRDNEVLRTLGTARRTRFLDCDLRGALVAGWRLDGTLFERCRLHGVEGEPRFEGAIQVLAADLSPEGDRSLLGLRWPT